MSAKQRVHFRSYRITDFFEFFFEDSGDEDFFFEFKIVCAERAFEECGFLEAFYIFWLICLNGNIWIRIKTFCTELSTILCPQKCKSVHFSNLCKNSFFSDKTNIAPSLKKSRQKKRILKSKQYKFSVQI